MIFESIVHNVSIYCITSCTANRSIVISLRTSTKRAWTIFVDFSITHYVYMWATHAILRCMSERGQNVHAAFSSFRSSLVFIAHDVYTQASHANLRCMSKCRQIRACSILVIIKSIFSSLMAYTHDRWNVYSSLSYKFLRLFPRSGCIYIVDFFIPDAHTHKQVTQFNDHSQNVDKTCMQHFCIAKTTNICRTGEWPICLFDSWRAKITDERRTVVHRSSSFFVASYTSRHTHKPDTHQHTNNNHLHRRSNDDKTVPTSRWTTSTMP